MNDTQERFADKITKLLAKAESTTPEEAEALTAKATALMIEHSIEMAVIDARRKGVGEPEKIVERRIEVGGIYWQAHRQLGFDIGNGFGFKLIQSNWASSKGMKGAFIWVGFESDIEKAELLYTSLLIQCMTALRPFAKEWKAQHGHLGNMEGFKARRSFIFGFASAIGHRLRDQQNTAQAAAVKADKNTDTAVTSVALALVDRKQKLNDYYDEEYGHLRRGRGSNLQGGVGGFNAGNNAGRNASLATTGLGGSKGSLGR